MHRHFKNSVIGLILGTAIGGVFSPSAVIADNLDVIEGSVDGLANSGKLPPKTEGSFFTDRPTLGSLFGSHDFSPTLFNWFGKLPLELRQVGDDASQDATALRSKRFYERADGEKLVITVIVPHPRSYDAVQLNLVLDIAALKPPRLQVVKEEEWKVSGQPGRFFEHKSGGCSLLFELKGPAFLQLQTPNCSNKEILRTSAEELDLLRFIAKINS